MMASRASHPYEALDTSRRRPRPIAKCAACALAAVAGARSLTVRRTGFAAEAVADVATDGGAPRSSGGGGGGGDGDRVSVSSVDYPEIARVDLEADLLKEWLDAATK